MTQPDCEGTVVPVAIWRGGYLEYNISGITDFEFSAWNLTLCRGGGTGRRDGLKIRWE